MRWISVLAVLAVGLAFPAFPEGSEAGESRTIAGIEVRIDPATGRLLRPDPERARELAEYLIRTLDRSAPGLELVRHPDGMSSIHLRGRLQGMTVATIDADHRVALRCLTGPEGAAELLEAATQGVDPVARGASLPRAVEK